MMSGELAISNTTQRIRGWMGVTAIIVVYAALYAANYGLPIRNMDYTSRIWNWSQTALMVTACFTLILHWRFLTTRAVLLGFALAILSALSHGFHDSSLSWSLQEGVAVWACFLAGVILFKNKSVISVPAFQQPLVAVGKSIVLGVLFAIPLTIVNNLYFYLNTGPIHWQNVFYSAFEALSPAIHEEIIFRFFVLALCLSLLRASTSSRWAIVIASFLAVVPHSLNHLPDLFLENPVIGLFMLTATSLLFGLPMAILQIKRNLETAIAFHWFIDFARFLFGF
jgi:hypothetical protein